MKKEKLDINFAVFNQHINDAGKIAIKTVNEMFAKGTPELKELNRMYKNGIMEIFKQEPSFVTGAYVALVYHIVNK